MGVSDELDVAAMLRTVVQPCLDELLLPGELDTVTLGRRTIRVPDRPRRDGLIISAA